MPVTIYINSFAGVMHVWQDGQHTRAITFSRTQKTICQWHWGVYAGTSNDNLILCEADFSIQKLGQPWKDFSVEPLLGRTVAVRDRSSELPHGASSRC